MLGFGGRAGRRDLRFACSFETRVRRSRSPSECRFILVGLALWFALLAGCATLPPVQVPVAQLPASQQARALYNLRVFNAVWDLVNRKHYDPKFQGVDWNAAAVDFGPKAAAAPDETALYSTLNAMLEPL